MNFTDIRIVTKLVLSHVRHRPARMLLTLMSTIAAACVVVWVVSGYDSLVAKFDEFADNYLGRYEFVVLPAAGGSESNGPFGAPAVRLTPEQIALLKEDAVVVAPCERLRARFCPLRPLVNHVGATTERYGGRRAPRTAGANGRPGRSHCCTVPAE